MFVKAPELHQENVNPGDGGYQIKPFIEAAPSHTETAHSKGVLLAEACATLLTKPIPRKTPRRYGSNRPLHSQIIPNRGNPLRQPTRLLQKTSPRRWTTKMHIHARGAPLSYHDASSHQIWYVRQFLRPLCPLI